ncbi:unnamed protein product [Gulo gulo]|uniref:Uncharacterized protein n=1 Tax=Gulo gulo TaxID=48420 RepID=A0A9X9M0E7_GULGU|nr:unnamed protein product [Gulo gulo]
MALHYPIEVGLNKVTKNLSKQMYSCC